MVGEIDMIKNKEIWIMNTGKYQEDFEYILMV